MTAVDNIKVNIGKKMGSVPRRRNAKAVEYDRARAALVSAETPETEATPDIENEIKIRKRSHRRQNGPETEVTDV